MKYVYEESVTAYVTLDPGELTVTDLGGKRLSVESMTVEWNPRALREARSVRMTGRWFLKSGKLGQDRHRMSYTLLRNQQERLTVGEISGSIMRGWAAER